MKVSFTKPGGENLAPAAVVAVPAETSTNTAAAPASPAPTVPVVYKAPSAPAIAPTYADSEEDVQATDLVIPRFNIVQKVGELSNLYTPGTIVMDGSLVLAEAPQPKGVSAPVRVLVVGLKKKSFVEKCEGGLRGDTYHSDQEVVENGGTLDWSEWQASLKTEHPKRYFQTLITALILVEKPEGVQPEPFQYVLGGKNFALCLYSMKGTSYTNAAKHFMSAKKIGRLRQTGYRGGWWTLQSKLAVYGANASFIPVVKPAESTTEEFRAELLNLLGF